VKEGLPAVLVASGGGFQGLAVLRLLGEADGFRIVVADSQETTVTAGFADATRRLPPVAERAAFTSALLELCRAEAVRLVLPSTDHELEALAEAAPALEAAGTHVAVCDATLLALVRDKQALYQRLAAEGFPVLAAWTGPPAEAGLPLIGKPRQGSGGRGVVVVRTPAELDALAPREREALVWQPFLDGALELSADLALLRGAGPPEVGLRRRVRTSGGFAVVSEGVVDADASALVKRFAEWAAARGGRGLFNVQLLRRGPTLVLSDVNPRLGTSAVHWRGSGFNPVLAVCAEAGLLPATARPARAPFDTRSVRHLDERIETLRAPGAEPLRGIVFDLDDTLIPTKRFIRERLLQALAAVVPEAERTLAERQALRVIEEGPRDRLIDAVAAALELAEPVRARLLEAYLTGWPASCACYREVKPSLDALRRRGLRLGLLTDNPPETQRQKLRASGLAPFFDALVFARETGAEKPDGRGFAAVAQALDLPPVALAMAGDNPHRDLAGAAVAGFARLFWVQREGASCGFDAALAEALPGSARYERVSDLRQLAARLSAG
jgi:HAD superfamily hydrolase (TIGR01549 family)